MTCISQSAIYYDKINCDYLKSYFSDSKDVAISPCRWNTTDDWIKVTAITGLTLGAYFMDEYIQQFTQTHKNKTLNSISKYGIENWGDGTYSIPLLGAIYLGASLQGESKGKEVALLGLKGFVISSATAYIFKLSLHRHRPNETGIPVHNVWDGPSIKFDHLSFVSGHTITAFTLATIIASEYNDTKIIPIVSYSLAGLTGLSRIYDNKHWISDVIPAAGLGYGIGKLIFNNNQKSKQKHRVQVAIFPNKISAAFFFNR